jgi:hypothetical protein
MSESDQDPSANTGRFRAFVERVDEDSAAARRFRVPPAVLVTVAVLIIVIIVIVALA